MTIDTNSIQIHQSRKEVLVDEFQKPYFSEIKEFLTKEKNVGKIIFPEGKNIFNAFNTTPFNEVKVVILWQDPYHGTGEAHGLCFSVQEGIKLPPSLKNIFKELNTDIGMPIPTKGNLSKRAEQWVFLLNASLTVEKDTPNSHKDIGRHKFTDAVIKTLSEKKEGLIFLLWWAFAQQKKELINTNKHIILEAPHPSPFSVHRWFFWCKHFSKTNELLKNMWKKEINWNIE